jgi:hypothetical protein
MAGEKRQPGPRVLNRNAGQQMQVIIDDRLRDGPAGQINNAGARLPQEQEEAEHALLIMVHPRDPRQHLPIQAQAGDDDHRPRRIGVGESLLERVSEAGLQGLQDLGLGLGWLATPISCS